MKTPRARHVRNAKDLKKLLKAVMITKTGRKGDLYVRTSNPHDGFGTYHLIDYIEVEECGHVIIRLKEF